MKNTRFVATYTAQYESDIIISQDVEHPNWIEITNKDRPDEKIILGPEDLEEFISILEAFKGFMKDDK